MAAAARFLSPGDGWAGFGPILRKATFNDDPDRITRPATLFSADAGRIVVDAQTLLPGKDVTGQTWVVTGTDSAYHLAGLVTVRTPADGLDPERWVTSLVAVDLKGTSGTLIRRTEVGDGGVRRDGGCVHARGVVRRCGGVHDRPQLQ